MPKSKSVKNMSVSELVEARKGYMDKVKDIDEVLGEAAKALGTSPISPLTPPLSVAPASRSRVGSYDPAFGPRDNYEGPVAAQVAVSTEAPVVAPRPNNTPDQSSGFTIFDADAFARKQAEADSQYLVDNPGVPVPPEFDFNNEEVSNEIDSIKEQLELAKSNEGDTKADTGEQSGSD